MEEGRTQFSIKFTYVKEKGVWSVWRAMRKKGNYIEIGRYTKFVFKSNPLDVNITISLIKESRKKFYL